MPRLPPDLTMIERLAAVLGERYRVLRELGAGGMATVYLAEDLKHGRRVAIKVLEPPLASSLDSERFLREVRIVTGLNHPHIVPVHDSGEADGLLYYVMPHVTGESLADLLERRGRIPPDEATELLREIAGALDYAHRMGTVHRDIKPDNILLSEGHALLADFGISHAVSDPADGRLTATGVTSGSAYYMSPEQASGDGPTDARSDVYSLGCLAYEILSGEPPFQGTSSRVLVQHLTERAVPLRERVPSLSPEHEAAVAEAMAKDPADRPASAGDFVRAMVGERTPKVVHRVPVGTFGALGVGVALLLGMLWWSGIGQAPSSGTELDPARVAVLYFDDLSPAGDLRHVSEGLTEELIHELGLVEPLTVVSLNGVKPYRDLAFPVDSLARLLGTGHLVEGSVERQGDVMVARIRLIDGETGTEDASEEIRASGSDLLELRTRIVAQAARFLGQALGRGIELVRARSETESPEAWSLVRRAMAMTDDADLLRWELADPAAADRTLLRADSLLAEAEALDPDWPEPSLQRGWVGAKRARLTGSRGRYNEAPLREGVAHADRILERRPTSAAALELRGYLLNDLSWLNTVAADPDRVMELRTRAERDLRTAVAEDESRVLAWVGLADLLRVQGDFSEAAIAARSALEADPFLINAEKEILFSLAQVWLDLGDVERALAWNDEGRRRYPAELAFTAGKLVVLAGWEGAPASPDTAWALADALRGWPPARLLAAGVLARAGLDDSARVVIDRVRETTAGDPWSSYYEANARVQLGDTARAVDLLESFLEALPGRRSYIAGDWWWRPLQDVERFRALVDSSG